MTRKVAIIGSGFSAWGALQSLENVPGIEVTVFDIGLVNPLPTTTEKEIPNSKKFKNSYFCYGANDQANPVELNTKRMCSSHALGGHSIVYSGSIHYPKDNDLRDWPKASIPSAEDYNAILSKLPLLSEDDDLKKGFPIGPDNESLSGKNDQYPCTLLGASRIAAKFSDSTANKTSYEVFDLRSYFKKEPSNVKYNYHDEHYVTHLSNDGDQVHIHFVQKDKEGSKKFDAVFVAAGCINTTAIIDRSMHKSGKREYNIYSPSSLIHAFLTFKSKRSSPIKTRQMNGLPEYFLEIKSNLTGGAWSHSQITRINKQIIDAICSSLPGFVRPLLYMLQNTFYFCLSSEKSPGTPAAKLISTIKTEVNGDGDKDILVQSITVVENEVGGYSRKLLKAVRLGVLANWQELKMIPFPFGVELADIFRKNKLGGWHFGGTIPMCANAIESQTTCCPDGEVRGLKSVFIADSAAFPSVPASTVALLTSAHAHRIAQKWIVSLENRT